MIGKIKNLLPSGYGFIVIEDGTTHFFHYTEYRGEWSDLEKICPPKMDQEVLVQFMPQEHKKGPRALKVELLFPDSYRRVE